MSAAICGLRFALLSRDRHQDACDGEQHQQDVGAQVNDESDRFGCEGDIPPRMAATGSAELAGRQPLIQSEAEVAATTMLSMPVMTALILDMGILLPAGLSFDQEQTD